MRVAIAAIGFAALAYVSCYQSAGAVVTSGTAIREAAVVGSLVRCVRLPTSVPDARGTVHAMNG